MRRAILVAIAVLLLSVPRVTSAVGAAAQETKTARGTVTAVAGDTVTVKVGNNDMKFTADTSTAVEAAGAGRRTRDARAQGRAGAPLGDVLKAGQAVEVTYRETGGVMRASRIRTISSAGAGGGSVATPAKSASGTVKSISADSLTVTSGGKDMTFAINASTRVVGRGAGTAARARGGRIPITDVVANGDSVAVSYRDADGSMRATQVSVVNKAGAPPARR